MQQIVIWQLRARSIFKIVFFGLTFSIVPFFIFWSLAAWAGLYPMEWRGQSLSGGEALLAGPVIGLLLSIAGSIVLTALLFIGLCIFSKMGNMVLYYRAPQ